MYVISSCQLHICSAGDKKRRHLLTLLDLTSSNAIHVRFQALSIGVGKLWRTGTECQMLYLCLGMLHINTAAAPQRFDLCTAMDSPPAHTSDDALTT